MKDRFIVYDTEYDGPRRKELTAGATQGSILGPDIWNSYYDRILRLELPDGCFLIRYADDVVALITARDVETAQRRLGQVMCRVRCWMLDHGLELAMAKTEIVLVMQKRIPRLFFVQVADVTAHTKASVKYLGVMLDTKFTFWEQIRRGADYAAEVTASLSRVITNIGGPQPCVRRLLLRATESIMLYGAKSGQTVRGTKSTANAWQLYREGEPSTWRARIARPGGCRPGHRGVIPVDLLAQGR